MAKKKDFRQTLDYNVSTWVSLMVKTKIYKIAERENTTVSNIVRKFIEKGVDEYEREQTC